MKNLRYKLIAAWAVLTSERWFVVTEKTKSPFEIKHQITGSLDLKTVSELVQKCHRSQPEHNHNDINQA